MQMLFNIWPHFIFAVYQTQAQGLVPRKCAWKVFFLQMPGVKIRSVTVCVRARVPTKLWSHETLLQTSSSSWRRAGTKTLVTGPHSKVEALRAQWMFVTPSDGNASPWADVFSRTHSFSWLGTEQNAAELLLLDIASWKHTDAVCGINCDALFSNFGILVYKLWEAQNYCSWCKGH